MLIFLSHPIQYISPLLRELSVQNLIVYYYGGEIVLKHDVGFGKKIAWDIPLLGGYNHVFLRNFSRAEGMNNNFFDAINWSVIGVIKSSADKIVVLNGWAYFSDWLVLFAAKFFGKKIWMRAEMPWIQEELKPKSIRQSVKFLFFKHLFFKYLIDKFLFIGSENKRYYLMHGVNEAKLVYAPYSVDNSRFQNMITDDSVTRQRWGVGRNDVVILFSGKLINKKRPFDLLKAFESINNSKMVLFYMGDGPLREDLENYINQYNIKNVIISGFINQSEIGSIYSIADIYVMCSGIGETWGLSVNEAMNFSLPIIISSTCGSSFDLVDDHVNGLIFEEGDIDMLSRHILHLFKNQDLRIKMGYSSRLKIQNFSHSVTCENIKRVTIGYTTF